MEVDYHRHRLACVLLLSLLVAAQPAAAESLVVLSQNMNRLFDDIDDGNDEPVLSARQFQARIERAVDKFAGEFSLPRIIALQEVENHNVLDRIAALIRQRHAVEYRALLLPGQAGAPINSAFLLHPSLRLRLSTQLFNDRRMSGGELLFSRPPLLIDACYLQHCLSLVNLHLRSMRGLDNERTRHRVARKRWQQARSLATWVQRRQRQRADSWFMLLGDFNALAPADRHVDVIGILRGDPDNSDGRLRSADLVEPDLVDLTRQLPDSRRYSYIYRNRKQQLDYAFANQALASRLQRVRFSRIDYEFSDHAGLILHFDWR